jgi:hypothetical protein
LPPETSTPLAWLARRPAGCAALVLGVAAFLYVTLRQADAWSTPALRDSLPGVGLTAALAVVSILRRERAATLWLAGLGLATIAVVLGYVVIMAVVVVATAILILLLHAVL